jgi:hypothetical protein
LENVEIFSGQLEHFMIIWYILCSFGTFLRFWYHVPRKIWQPWIKVHPKFFDRNGFSKNRSLAAEFGAELAAQVLPQRGDDAAVLVLLLVRVKYENARPEIDFVKPFFETDNFKHKIKLKENIFSRSRYYQCCEISVKNSSRKRSINLTPRCV